jgi:hypothetical protein
MALRAAEDGTLVWASRKVKETKDEQGLVKFLSFIYSEQKVDVMAKTREFVQQCGGTAEGVAKCCDDARGSYALMAAKLALPPEQFVDEWDRVEAKHLGNPIFRMLSPAIGKVRWAQARADERRALFEAALDVQLHGQEALKNHPDPVVGGPFEYEAFADGFELRSKLTPSDRLRKKWKLDDHPMTLTVGQKQK